MFVPPHAQKVFRTRLWTSVNILNLANRRGALHNSRIFGRSTAIIQGRSALNFGTDCVTRFFRRLDTHRRANTVKRRKGRILLLALRLSVSVLAIASACALRAQEAHNLPQRTAAAIQKRIQESAARVGVAFRTLDGKTEWYFHADDSFHAASTMKVAVMIELFRQVHQGKLKLGDTLPVRNEFRSIVDGSPYSLQVSGDSEPEIYKAVGQSRTLGDLCEGMITRSSNLATNLLIDKLGVDNIRATMHSLHADGMNVLRGVEDGKAYQKGLNNTTTARALLLLLEAIAKGQAVDAHASASMTEILERQTFHEGIPAGLPRGTRVAHKTGEITNIHHDAGTVYGPRPFVLVVLTAGAADFRQSSALIADITRGLYRAAQ